MKIVVFTKRMSEQEGPDLRPSGNAEGEVKIVRQLPELMAEVPVDERRCYEAAYIFKYLAFAQVLVYLEAGSVPAMLVQLSTIFDMNQGLQGLLGGIVYLMLSFGSPIAGYFYEHYNVRVTMGITLVLNNLLMLAFALTPVDLPGNWSAVMLILFRGAIGFTQSFLCVYAPLWVDEFSPAKKRTSWLSFLQAGVPVGVMGGYIMGTVSVWTAASDPSQCYHLMCWRWPYLVQVILVCPMMIGIFFIPSDHLEVGKKPFISNSSNPRHSPGLQSRQDMLKRLTSTESGYGTIASASSAGAAAIAVFAPTCSRMEKGMDKEAMQEERHQERLRPLGSASINDAVHGKTSFPCTTTTSRQDQEDDDEYFYDKRPKGKSLSLSVEEGGVDDSSCLLHQQLQTQNGGGEHNGWCSSVVVMAQESAELLNYPVYLLVVFGTSALYFVVTGIQFWATAYLLVGLGGNEYEVNSLFVLSAATAPILGVFFGGWLIDHMGGYKGLHQRTKALGTCSAMGALASLTSSMAAFVYGVKTSVLLVWFTLFFGGSVLPACTGILISCVPRRLRAAASSTSVVSFNLLGNFLSPALSGYVMEFARSYATCDEPCSLRVGFRLILLYGNVALISLLGAWIVSWGHASRHRRG